MSKPVIYDPGQFRYRVAFYQQSITPDSSGGAAVSLDPLLQTRAVRLPIRDGSQLAIDAGCSSLNQDCYFVIRHRCGFYPTKSMELNCDEVFYMIAAIIEVNEPVNYLKVLCKRKV